MVKMKERASGWYGEKGDFANFGVLNSDKAQIVVQSWGCWFLRPVFWRKSEIVKLRLSWFFARF
jgi:hypothetical protein